jgi:hypothetical protein
MHPSETSLRKRGGWLLVAAVVYFIAYPEDLQACLAPVQLVLQLTNELAGGAWLLAGVALVCWTALRFANARTTARRSVDGSPTSPS